MNTATTYGFLAATLLAVYKLRQSGAANVESQEDISDVVYEFLKRNQGGRADALLATLYSFLDLEDVDFDLSLASLTTQDSDVEIPLQPIFFYKVMTELSDNSVVEALVDNLLESQSDPAFAEMWNRNVNAVYHGYVRFFQNNDAGVAFNFVSLGIYPATLNRDQWSQYFKGSKVGASGFVEPPAQKEIEVQRLFAANLYANTEKVLEQEGGGLRLTGPMSIDSLFAQSEYVFQLLKEHLGNLEVKLWSPIEIGMELNRLATSASPQTTIETNAYYIEFVLKALDWTNRMLQQKNKGAYSETYGGLYDYLNSPSRIPSDIMVTIEMDGYRSNPLTQVVDKIYRGDGKKKGLLQQKWRDYTTPSWTIVSWILYYIYSMFKRYQLPSMLKYSEGLKASMRLHKGMVELNRKGKSVTAYNSDITSMVERVMARSGNSEETQAIKQAITEGHPDGASDDNLPIGLSKRSPNPSNLGALVFETKNMRVYKSENLPEDHQHPPALGEFGQFLGHCAHDVMADFIYTVFIDGIPYYTVSTQRRSSGDGGAEEQLLQWKGLQNRIPGFSEPLSKTPAAKRDKKIGVRSKSRLAVDDAYNVSIFLAGIENIQLQPFDDVIVSEDFAAIWPLIRKGKTTESFSDAVFNVLTSR